MKNLSFYKTSINCDTKDQVFDYLIGNLKPGNQMWSYFVNWEKVVDNTQNIELALNSLNYLIGKDDFDKEFKFLLNKNPFVIPIIPSLIARDGKNTKNFNILVEYENKKLVYENYDFSKTDISDKDISSYLHFVKETGLKGILTNKKIKNLVDYMTGIEVGLDSNGRKNRSGHAMEKIVEVFVKDVCEKNNFTYLKEANSEKIKKELGYDVPVDKASRRYDFVIDNGKELFIIETNFYGGGGSKLKSTAGEYVTLHNTLDRDKYKFIWITDGKGWDSTIKPLRETFDNNDYIFNLAMLEKGILEFILKQNNG